MGACASAFKTVGNDDAPAPREVIPNTKETITSATTVANKVNIVKVNIVKVVKPHVRSHSLEELLSQSDEDKLQQESEALSMSSESAEQVVKIAYVAPVARATEE